MWRRNSLHQMAAAHWRNELRRHIITRVEIIPNVPRDLHGFA